MPNEPSQNDPTEFDMDSVREVERRFHAHSGYLEIERAKVKEQIASVERLLSSIYMAVESNLRQMFENQSRLEKLQNRLSELPEKIDFARDKYKKEFENFLIGKLVELEKEKQTTESKLQEKESKRRRLPWSKK